MAKKDNNKNNENVDLKIDEKIENEIKNNTDTESKNAKLNSVETDNKKKQGKKTTKLTDDTLITVRNNVYGKLVYVDTKTGDKTIWSNYGDEQDITIGELRWMKRTQIKFFKEHWILFIKFTENEYKNNDINEVYKNLQVNKYYDKITSINYISKLLNSTVDKLKKELPKLNSTDRQSLIVCANNLIKNGELDSLKKIKTIEKLLDCELSDVK